MITTFIENAVIESTDIYYDHGILTFRMRLRFSGGVQSFGGWACYNPKAMENDCLGQYIHNVLRVVDVETVEDLNGKAIRVRGRKASILGSIEAVGHLLKDEWFEPVKHMVGKV